jgi:hypothetical protein
MVLFSLQLFDLYSCWEYIHLQETFRRLPLPYADQEFNIDPIKKEEMESLTTPPPYVHLKHSILCVPELKLVDQFSFYIFIFQPRNP